TFSPAAPVAADPRVPLHALHDAILAEASAPWHAESDARRSAQAGLKRAERQRTEERLRKGWERRPIAPARLMWELKEALPEGAVVVSEAITASADLIRML